MAKFGYPIFIFIFLNFLPFLGSVKGAFCDFFVAIRASTFQFLTVSGLFYLYDVCIIPLALIDTCRGFWWHRSIDKIPYVAVDLAGAAAQYCVVTVKFNYAAYCSRRLVGFLCLITVSS